MYHYVSVNIFGHQENAAHCSSTGEASNIRVIQQWDGRMSIYACMVVCVYICMCVCMYVCVCMYLCMCVYVYMYVCAGCIRQLRIYSEVRVNISMLFPCSVGMLRTKILDLHAITVLRTSSSMEL